MDKASAEFDANLDEYMDGWEESLREHLEDIEGEVSEGLLLEAAVGPAFSGETKDKRGRRRCYANGKIVKCGDKGGAPSGGRREAQQAHAAASKAHAAVQTTHKGNESLLAHHTKKLKAASGKLDSAYTAHKKAQERVETTRLKAEAKPTKTNLAAAEKAKEAAATAKAKFLDARKTHSAHATVQRAAKYVHADSAKELEAAQKAMFAAKNAADKSGKAAPERGSLNHRLNAIKDHEKETGRSLAHDIMMGSGIEQKDQAKALKAYHEKVKAQFDAKAAGRTVPAKSELETNIEKGLAAFNKENKKLGISLSPSELFDLLDKVRIDVGQHGSTRMGVNNLDASTKLRGENEAGEADIGTKRRAKKAAIPEPPKTEKEIQVIDKPFSDRLAKVKEIEAKTKKPFVFDVMMNSNIKPDEWTTTLLKAAEDAKQIADKKSRVARGAKVTIPAPSAAMQSIADALDATNFGRLADQGADADPDGPKIPGLADRSGTAIKFDELMDLLHSGKINIGQHGAGGPGLASSPARQGGVNIRKTGRIHEGREDRHARPWASWLREARTARKGGR